MVRNKINYFKRNFTLLFLIYCYLLFYNIFYSLDFIEKFDLDVKDGYLEENLLKSLESNKIKIFLTLNNSQNVRFIKVYVSKVWNLCRMLNYTRNIKDTDNNYFLLRLKDFLCDLYILIFSSINEITIHDIFNLIQLVTEVGSQWMKLDIQMSVEGWIKKVDNIMKYLVSKINDLENIIHFERKFYINFVEYMNFYIENFLLSSPLQAIQCQSDNSLNIIKGNKNQEILKIITLIKNIKFLENDNSTRNLISNILNLLKTYNSGNSEINNNNVNENTLILFEELDSIKFKYLLPNDLLSEFYKIYIFNLISSNFFENAEAILKRLFQYVTPNSKEEIECYYTNLEICVHYDQTPEILNKIKDIIEIIFDLKEFNFENFEELIIISTNYNFFNLLFDIFLSKLKSTKVLRISNNNNNIIFNYENLKKYKILCFLFIFNFFKSIFFSKFSNTSEIAEFSNNYSNLFEILKILSECILENYSTDNYEEEYSGIIPTLFKNIVIVFLRIEKQNENFSSYFLLETIKKFQNSKYEKEFIDLSLEIYLEKKDYIKLKNMITELEGRNLTNNNALFHFSNLIILVKEGNKWNALGKLNTVCYDLNSAQDFHIIYYLKLFNFIIENNPSDFSLISTILQNFSIKFLELFKNEDYEKIKYEDKVKNKQMSFFDVIFEILIFYSKLNNFPNQICHFVDFLNFLGNSVEFVNLNESSHLLTSNLMIVLEIINLLINYKNVNSIIKVKACEDFPEFILISCCKLLNFIFNNFFIFSNEFFNIEENLIKDQIKSVVDIFELYKNLSLFYFSYNFANLNIKEEESIIINQIEQGNKILEFQHLSEIYQKYQKNFDDGVIILKNKFFSNQEYFSYLEEKLTNIKASTKIIDQIFTVQLKSKLENEDNFEEYIQNLAISYIENKKILFIVNSILYQSGFKLLSSRFMRKILNQVISMFGEYVPKFYSIEDVFTLYKEYINLVEINTIKINCIKEFSNIMIKLGGRIDEVMQSDNVEWILFKIFNLIEGIGADSKVNKNDKDFQTLKQIYDELSLIVIKNKSFVLNNLFDIVLKKILL